MRSPWLARDVAPEAVQAQERDATLSNLKSGCPLGPFRAPGRAGPRLISPRKDAALCCDGLIAGTTRETPSKAPLGPVTSALARRAASDLPQGRTPLHRLKTRDVGCSCTINQEEQSLLASPRGRTRHLWCAVLIPCKKRIVPTKAPPWPDQRRGLRPSGSCAGLTGQAQECNVDFRAILGTLGASGSLPDAAFRCGSCGEGFHHGAFLWDQWQ